MIKPPTGKARYDVLKVDRQTNIVKMLVKTKVKKKEADLCADILGKRFPELFMVVETGKFAVNHCFSGGIEVKQ